MRKLILTTAAVAAAIAGVFAAEPSFGTFTDARDGQKYRWVVIGGKTWMAQNLNYKAPSDPWGWDSWCYENSADSCNKYGRLYSWNAAITACPAGYHLPSREEWDSLTTTVGGKEVAGQKLKAKSGWYINYATDDYKFSALPGGMLNDDGNFTSANYYGNWWTSTENNGKSAYPRIMHCKESSVLEFPYSKRGGFSVRCVADSP
jgi:uncharacterized protein (TIGR02145 family)